MPIIPVYPMINWIFANQLSETFVREFCSIVGKNRQYFPVWQ